MKSALVGNVHIVEGDAGCIPQLLELLAREDIVKSGDPDLYVRDYARFGIEDAREVRERAALRPAQGRRPGRAGRVFIIVTPNMTSDAQNALLKTLEETPGDALFFLVVPSPRALLPTVRSRAHMLSLEKTQSESIVDPKAFLAAPPQKRLEMLSPLLEKDEDDKRDLRPILSFLTALESRLAAHPETLRPLYTARKYIADKGALIKPLLEEVALLTPRV